MDFSLELVFNIEIIILYKSKKFWRILSLVLWIPIAKPTAELFYFPTQFSSYIILSWSQMC